MADHELPSFDIMLQLSALIYSEKLCSPTKDMCPILQYCCVNAPEKLTKLARC